MPHDITNVMYRPRDQIKFQTQRVPFMSNPYDHALPIKDIHEGPSGHMGMSPSIPHDPTFLDLPLKESNLIRSFLVPSLQYHRPCLSLLCPPHWQHQTPLCVSFDKQWYLLPSFTSMIQLHAHNSGEFLSAQPANPTWQYVIGPEGRACGTGSWGYHSWSMRYMHEQNKSPGYCPLLTTLIKLFLYRLFLSITTTVSRNSSTLIDLEYSRIPSAQEVVAKREINYCLASSSFALRFVISNGEVNGIRKTSKSKGNRTEIRVAWKRWARETINYS